VSSGCQHDTPGSSDWEAWLVEHAPALLLFARQQSRSESDAQDLVQDAVIECWQRQSHGAPPPLGLVFATIRHRAIDLARSNTRRANREVAANQDAAQFWFDPNLEDRERTRFIEEAMRQISDIYREVITLKIWGDLTFAEIAEVLDIPANTAASRYRYGLGELRKLTKQVFA
jgi:RNA polymerase sigma-70 factor (ECF subfamily)